MRALALIELLLLSGVAIFASAAEPFIGAVKTAQGGASLRRGTDTTPLREGTQLLMDDVLITADDGRVGVILRDGTRIALGPKTELKIDRFVYQPSDGKFGLVIHLVRGVLAYVSGKIAQFMPGSVSVETPMGVIGLRGTSFAVTIEGG